MTEKTKKKHKCRGCCPGCPNKQKKEIPIVSIPITQTN